MSAPIKTCACGRSFTRAQWDDLPDFRVYRPLPDDEPDTVWEQRRCPCGSHIVIVLDERGNLPGADSGTFLATGVVAALGCVLVAASLMGCGGAPFSSAPMDHPVIGAPDAASDSGGAEVGTGVEGGSDAGTVEEGGQEAEAGPVEAGPTPVQACVAYFAARQANCACVANYHGCDQQVTDAGDCPSALGACQTSCAWDGGNADDTFCYCIFSCLSAGPCLLPNQAYMACDVSTCTPQNCP